MRKFLVLLVVFAGLNLPVIAQDETPPAPTEEPTPPPDEAPPVVPPVLEAPTIDELLTAINVTLTAILAGVIASPVTSAFVSLIKLAGDRFKIALIINASGSQINTVVVFVLVGTIWAARFFGVASQLDSAFKIVLALAPIVGGMAFGARASSGWYGNITRNKVSLVGYARPKEVAKLEKAESALAYPQG